MSENRADITAERLLIMKFPNEYSRKYVEKMLQRFIAGVNTSFNGNPVRLFCIGDSWSQPYSGWGGSSLTAILAVWTPTEDTSDAPISIQELKLRLEAIAASAPWWRRGSFDFLEPDARIQLWKNVLILTETMRARELYVYERGLQPALSDKKAV